MSGTAPFTVSNVRPLYPNAWLPILTIVLGILRDTSEVQFQNALDPGM
jgi:hypothetical protein